MVALPEDRLILDRDVPEEIVRLRIGNNPIDVDEVMKFTLEADLDRLSKLMKENRPYVDQKATIKRRMKQAEEDRDKLSERGIVAFDYLQSRKEIWNK